MPYRLGEHNRELIYHTNGPANAPRDDWTFVMCVITGRGVDPAQVVADLNAAERRRWPTGVIVPPEVQQREQPERYGHVGGERDAEP